MAKDRLAELQAKSVDMKAEEKTKKGKKGSKKVDPLAAFLKEVSAIEEKLKKLSDDVKEMKKIQLELFCSPFYREEQVKELEKLSDQIMNSSTPIRKDIEALKMKSNGGTKAAESETLLGSEDKLKSTQLDRLRHELITTMNNFRSAQSEYIEKTKARYKRQIEIVTNGQADAESCAVDYDANHTIFTDNILLDMQESKGMLQDIEQREQDFLQLESQISQVNQLFKEVNHLVADQGETLNTIEQNVVSAVNDVENAEVKLKTAKVHRTNARRTKFIIAGIVVVVIIVVIIILAVTLS